MLFNLNNFASLKVISKGLKDSNIFFVHVLMKDWIERVWFVSESGTFQWEKFLSLFKNIRIFFIAGETVYAASTKKTTSGGGTLGRRTRRGHASALSSSSTASDRSETVFPDEHTRMHLTNGEEDSARIFFTYKSSRDYYFKRMIIALHRMLSHTAWDKL